jgi:sirohydrochlorin ferrochelatase
MKALLLIAHGSRREASNDEVRELSKQRAKRTNDEFPIVECAFLELADPLIPDGVTACVQKGAETVTVLPYFLSAGRHVVTDIPEELEKAQAQNPNITIKTAPYLGSAEGVSEILIELSKQAR